ncbi:restriction endonuclease [Anaerosolibacter sp.]|uniref:restriction endonuclease n=1 Tax=Anaerosolibacter sp. TaxID=1872527 RepID=UPI0039F0D5BE
MIQWVMYAFILIAMFNFVYYVFQYVRLKHLAEFEAKKFLYSIFSRRHMYDLTPAEFEEWIAIILRKSGYEKVMVTPISGDGGKDIICEKDGREIYVECKRYMYPELAAHLTLNGQATTHNEVGREICQKLVGAMVGDNVHRGMIITTSVFHDNAKEYVSKLPEQYKVELIDGSKLCEMYEEVAYKEFGIQKPVPFIDILK